VAPQSLARPQAPAHPGRFKTLLTHYVAMLRISSNGDVGWHARIADRGRQRHRPIH
jgi:hypothetical protein